jgi:hypothetical protein
MVVPVRNAGGEPCGRTEHVGGGGNLIAGGGVAKANLVERSAMRRYVIAVALVGALVLPVLAAAKGPVSASISGPGLDRSLAIRGDGEGPGTALGTLASASGFFAQMFGQSPDPTLASRPAGTLGPRYRAVYVVPGPNDVQSRVVQYIYPYAKPVALTYLKPGQVFWDGRKAHGGWYRASAALKRVLLRAGLPARAGL